MIDVFRYGVNDRIHTRSMGQMLAGLLQYPPSYF
jgi:hypothetical protein